MKEHPKLNAII